MDDNDDYYRNATVQCSTVLEAPTSKLSLNEFYSCYELDREARTKSAKYLRNCFESKSRILVVNSKAVSVGQFWAGRKTLMKNVYAS